MWVGFVREERSDTLQEKEASGPVKVSTESLPPKLLAFSTGDCMS